VTDERCDDCGSELRELEQDRTGDLLCLSCYARRYPEEYAGPEIDAEPFEPVRLEKIDGRYTLHDRRYGARRYDFANLLARAELEPPYRVNPIAVDGHLTVLAATGGDGKTWLGFAMAAGVAHGSPVAGMDCAPGRAVIFDAENGAWVLGSRLKALEEGMPADRVSIYDAEGLRLSDPEDRAWMLATIRAEQANLVIIDALRPLAPDAEENSSDAMAPVVIGAKQLARDSGAAVVLIHHRGNDAQRDFRGSTAIRDQADLLFVLEREERDPERKWRRRLRCAKCRIAAEPADRWFGIRGHRGYVTLTEAAAPETGGPKPTVRLQLAEDALDVLNAADGPMSQGAIARALGREKGDRSVRRALDHLTEKHAVIPTGDGYIAGGGNNGSATPATHPLLRGGGSSLRSSAADTPAATVPATPGQEAT
jgi:hypothetical protein